MQLDLRKLIYWICKEDNKVKWWATSASLKTHTKKKAKLRKIKEILKSVSNLNWTQHVLKSDLRRFAELKRRIKTQIDWLLTIKIRRKLIFF